jgi:hypothetical protein
VAGSDQRPETAERIRGGAASSPFEAGLTPRRKSKPMIVNLIGVSSGPLVREEESGSIARDRSLRLVQ